MRFANLNKASYNELKFCRLATFKKTDIVPTRNTIIIQIRLAKCKAIWLVDAAAPEPVVAERTTGASVFGLFVAQDLFNVLARAEGTR